MILLALALVVAAQNPGPAQAQAAPPPGAAPLSPPQIAALASAADWQRIADKDLLVMTLESGRVVIQLAPEFAPVHVENIRKFARARWWDGETVYRVQDNYVTQWGDATERKALPAGVIANPPAEVERLGVATVPLPSRDAYAARTGVSASGWPVAANSDLSWLTHCYAMVGVARDLAPRTGSGGDLYTVIGHAPRHLDRNIALVGRVIEGMALLSSLPRGTAALGVYDKAEQRVPIRTVRLASDLPAAERPRYETLNPRSGSFVRYAAARANREPPFFTVPAGGADVCNVPVPVRSVP